MCVFSSVSSLIHWDSPWLRSFRNGCPFLWPLNFSLEILKEVLIYINPSVLIVRLDGLRLGAGGWSIPHEAAVVIARCAVAASTPPIHASRFGTGWDCRIIIAVDLWVFSTSTAQILRLTPRKTQMCESPCAQNHAGDSGLNVPPQQMGRTASWHKHAALVCGEPSEAAGPQKGWKAGVPEYRTRL